MNEPLSTVVEQGQQDDVRRKLMVSRAVRRWTCLFSLALSDVFAFAMSALIFRAGSSVPELVFLGGVLPVSGSVDLFMLMAGVFLIVSYIAGDYTRRQLFWDETRHTTVALIFTSMPCILLYFVMQTGYSALTTFGSCFFVIAFVPMMRQATRWFLSKIHLWQLPTALIGEGKVVCEMMAAFASSLSLGFEVKLVVTKDVANVPQCPGVTCISLRNPTNIVRRLGQAGCLEAVITSEIAMNPETDSLVEKLMAAGVKVAVVPPLRGLPLLGLTSNYFFGRELLLLHIRNNMSRLPTRVFKRLLDLGGSITLLIVLAPALIGIAVFIKIFEGGDVLFVQPRVGRNGREFFCYKFRSMKPDAEDVLQKWKEQNSEWYRLYVASNYKLADDPRVTQVGRIMRRTSLDELPQLFNVLIGDMSLVGPRPLLTREVAHYGATIELYQQIRPGITGLWQITGRSHTSFDDRVTSDEWYIKNWSFWYDLIILIKTAGVLLMRRGAY